MIYSTDNLSLITGLVNSSLAPYGVQLVLLFLLYPQVHSSGAVNPSHAAAAYMNAYRPKKNNDVFIPQSHHWQSNPAPGLDRRDSVVREDRLLRDRFGNVIGRRQGENVTSRDRAEREHRFDDGTKHRLCISSEETKNSYRIDNWANKKTSHYTTVA